MRFLHQNCVPRVRLEAEQIELAEQRYAHQEALRLCGRDNALLESELAVAKDVAASFERDAERLTKERDEARYWLAAAKASVVDLRGAGVLTRDDIVSVLSGWSLERLHILSSDEMSALVDALLAAQRKTPAEALQSVVETATEGVTQEVGE